MKFALLAGGLLAVAGCSDRTAADLGGAAVSAGSAPNRASVSFDDEVRQLLRTRLGEQRADRLSARGERVHARATLTRFYETRAFAPAWLQRVCPAQEAWTLLDHLRAAGTDGLRPPDYHIGPLAELLQEGMACHVGAWPSRSAADLELLATDGFLLLSSHLVGGRLDPETLGGEWHAKRRELDLAALLEDALGKHGIGAALALARPASAEYAQLRAALSRHELAAKRAVPPAPDVPDAIRARQIAVNLERWRWLPEKLGARYIRVNVPAFELEVVEDGVPVLAMRAVVGKPYRQTPVLSATMTHLVVNPSWGVPRSVATADILPRIKADSSYLEKHGFSLFRDDAGKSTAVDPVTVDWKKTSASQFPYRLRQKPGPENSLGKIKFLFPNPFSVYIHDTPARDLFGQDERTFSSGCIRVEKVADLAEYVLRGDPKWTRAALDTAIASKREQSVRLPVDLPVHLVYFTAWTDGEGNVHFRRDPYHRDRRVQEALEAPPPAFREDLRPGRANASRESRTSP